MRQATRQDIVRAAKNGASTTELLTMQGTPESRFVLSGMRLTASRGGHPTCAYEDGIGIVFTYPDGTRTSGGKRIA